MKLTYQKDDLLNGINIVLKAVPSKTTMPILQCILIDAMDNQIKLTANDMELGIETKVEGTILSKGKIALEAKILSEIIRKLSGRESSIIIESDEKYTTTITCDNSVFQIQGKNGEEFSYLPFIEKDHYICLSQFSLKEVIRQTLFSISSNDSNKMMTGELFQVTGNELKVVSLDGHRISIRKIALKNSYGNKKVVVPGKTLSEVSKILSGDMDKDVSIFFTDKHILFEFNDTVVVSRLIEGEYFKIDQMLSSDYETKIKMNKRELLDCIDRATLLVKEGDKKPVIIDVKDTSMQLKMNSTVGSMDEDIDIDKEGKDLKIGFNPKFLIDALRVIEDEEIIIYMVNPKAPCFIKDESESYIYMILPVNFINVE